MWGVRYYVGVAVVLLLAGKSADSKSAPLPSFISTCSRNDPKLGECIVKKGREFLPLIVKGIPKLFLPPLDPLVIPEVIVERTGSGREGVGATFITRNVTITGLKDIIMDDVKADLKQDSGRFDSWFTVPRLEIVSKYEIKGKILILPIEGKGDANFTLVGNKLYYWTSYKLKDKDGEQFMSPTGDDLTFNTSRAYFHLTNLFNGDKALGDNMNVFLNENWNDVIKEIGPDIIIAVKKVIHNMTYGLLDTFSFNSIFPEK